MKEDKGVDNTDYQITLGLWFESKASNKLYQNSLEVQGEVSCILLDGEPFYPLSVNKEDNNSESKSMSSKHDKFPITGTWITEASSGKAFLFHIDNGDGSPSPIKKWLPHSQTKMEGTDERVTEHTGTMHITIPLWLAENEGIFDLYREEAMDREYADEEDVDMEDRTETEDPGWGS